MESNIPSQSAMNPAMFPAHSCSGPRATQLSTQLSFKDWCRQGRRALPRLEQPGTPENNGWETRLGTAHSEGSRLGSSPPAAPSCCATCTSKRAGGGLEWALMGFEERVACAKWLCFDLTTMVTNNIAGRSPGDMLAVLVQIQCASTRFHRVIIFCLWCLAAYTVASHHSAH